MVYFEWGSSVRPCVVVAAGVRRAPPPVISQERSDAGRHAADAPLFANITTSAAIHKKYLR